MSRHKRQEKKTKKIAELADRGVPNEMLEVVDAVFDIVEESENTMIEGMVETGKALDDMGSCLERIEETVKKKSEETYELSEEDRAKLKGDKGDSYVLTEADKDEIAGKIKPTVVEKVIERTTVRTEVPIVHNYTKEIKVPAEIPNEIYESLEELQANEKKIFEMLQDGKGKGKEIQIIGGSNGIFIYVDGVKKGIAKTINFVGAEYSLVNGRATLTFSGGGSGGANIESEKVTGVQAGSEVTLDLETLSNEATKVLQVSRQGQILTPISGWSVSGTLLTIHASVGADASEDFVVQYTY